MCGNGVRVFARYLRREGLAGRGRGRRTGWDRHPRGVKCVRIEPTADRGGPGAWRVDLRRPGRSGGQRRRGDGRRAARSPARPVARPRQPARRGRAAARGRARRADLTAAPLVTPLPRARQRTSSWSTRSCGDGVGTIRMRVHERGVGETRSLRHGCRRRGARGPALGRARGARRLAGRGAGRDARRHGARRATGSSCAVRPSSCADGVVRLPGRRWADALAAALRRAAARAQAAAPDLEHAVALGAAQAAARRTAGAGLGRAPRPASAAASRRRGCAGPRARPTPPRRRAAAASAAAGRAARPCRPGSAGWTRSRRTRRRRAHRRACTALTLARPSAAALRRTGPSGPLVDVDRPDRRVRGVERQRQGDRPPAAAEVEQVPGRRRRGSVAQQHPGAEVDVLGAEHAARGLDLDLVPAQAQRDPAPVTRAGRAAR